jgi:signal peptidase I
MSASRHSVRLGAILRDVLEAVLVAVVLFVVLQFGLQNTIVDGPSMEPNFVAGQWLIVNKLTYRFGPPARGDVIVFYAPDGSGKEYIKRVIALPGETVALRRGQVAVDGVPLDEPWLPQRDGTAFGPYVVPPGTVFVLGDNRPMSNDSRTWISENSALADDRIIGRAWLSIWPRGRWGVVGSDRVAPGRPPDLASR